MKEFEELWEIVERLRDPENGCPWDLEQTPESLIPNFIEELYESIEAIENNDAQQLKEELGDLLLHILMQIRIAKERNMLTPQEVIKNLISKLIRRHPHVFTEGDEHTRNVQQVKQNWEKIKHFEKSERKSILEGIPKSMPALIFAQRMQEKAASIGFDWDNSEDVLEKVEEEIAELKDSITKNNRKEIEEEMGDLLFSLVNYCRKSGIDSELVLKRASEKFRTRFQEIELYHRKNSLNLYDSTMEQLNELWEKAKATL